MTTCQLTALRSCYCPLWVSPSRLAVDHRHETSRLPLAKRIYSAPYGRTDDEVVKNLIKAGTYLEAAAKAGATESSQKLAKLGKDIHTYASDVYKAADDKKDAIIKESSNMISSWKDTLNKEKNKLIDEFQKFINH